jgi:disulfide oxidoreductase YuzD
VELTYLDASRDEVRAEHAVVVSTIQESGFVYPVTVIDGTPCCEGAVSYPVIMRAVESALSETAAP